MDDQRSGGTELHETRKFKGFEKSAGFLRDDM
jgi:hypothetical protein